MSDALLSPAVGLGFHAASATLLGVAARRAAQDDEHERRLPMMGVLGAFVFAAQMVTFAIPGTGSSGHLGGGTLLAILLGGPAGFLVMASVLTVQALFFADGGLLALGCNLFNLGFWPAVAGAALHRAGGARWRSGRGAVAASMLASVVSVELGAAGAAFQTALSGRAELSPVHLLLWMLAIHLPIALVEGAATASMVRALAQRAPDRGTTPRSRRGRFPAIATIAGAALFLGTAMASVASRRPDGLTWSVARALRQGPAEHQAGIGRWVRELQDQVALLPGYAFRNAEQPRAGDIGTSAAGVLGSILVAGLTALVGAAVAISRRALRTDRPRPPHP